jgi:hypothetical protein
MAKEKDFSDMTIKERLQNEKKKLKELSFKKKIEYIWDYYKPIMVGIILTITLVSVIIQMAINISKEDVLYIATINSVTQMEENFPFVEGFKEYAAIDERKQVVTVDTSLMLNYESEDMDEYYMSAVMKLAAIIAARQLDVMLMEESVYNRHLYDGTFYDLHELLPEELYKRVEPYLIWGITEEESTSRPYAIDVTDIAEVDVANTFGDKEILLGVITNTKNQEYVIQFIEYLFNE